MTYTKLGQTTANIFMVRPANFGFNPETAASNAFQVNDQSLSPNQIREKAKEEFDAFVNKLRKAGVNVIVGNELDQPVKPDSVFPNNWITLHHNGTVITYPMQSPTRRTERSEAFISQIEEDFQINKRIHFEDSEAENKFLEGTGSMIFDHPNRLVYACLSPRSDKELLEKFAKWADYQPVIFNSVDAQGQDIYHTNVMMAMGESFVVICLESIKDEEDMAMLKRTFALTNKEIINISLEQVNAFAGNMLQVCNEKGETFLMMSEQAYRSLNVSQIAQIKKHTNILYSPIPTIETYGGGSARCMMAEIFLEKK